MHAHRFSAGLGLALAFVLFSAAPVEGQGRGRGGAEPSPSVSADVTISVGDRDLIRQFYAERPAQNVEALPPGIRRNLERGKPIPPGIAKRNPPADLRSRLTLRQGFEVVEVGLDVLLVEAATGIIHDVLMDVIR